MDMELEWSSLVEVQTWVSQFNPPLQYAESTATNADVCTNKRPLPKKHSVVAPSPIVERKSLCSVTENARRQTEACRC
jgi:hypothetical protein